MDKLKQAIFENLGHAEMCADYWLERFATGGVVNASRYLDHASRWRFVAQCMRDVLKDAGIENEYEEWRNSDD